MEDPNVITQTAAAQINSYGLKKMQKKKVVLQNGSSVR
jgi:hypothetical protein